MSDKFDVVVIGAGPGGYVAAIRAAQYGLNVGIIERRKALGGTCLNVGCIPSKALLESSEHYHQAHTNFNLHGIELNDLKVNLKQMMKRKDDVVSTTTKGIEFLMSKNNITTFHGTASFKDAHTVIVDNGDANQEVSADKFIIATGSEPTPLPTVETDGNLIITSDEALSLTKIPKHMIVIGGGIIGCELGSVFARIGSKVTIVEFMDRIIPTMDAELGKHLMRSLKKIGIDFKLKTKVTGFKKTAKAVALEAENSKGETLTLKSDCVLVSIGRRPYTKGLGLENVGIELDDRGRIKTSDQFQTQVPNIFAIGDVREGIMLAHKASEEGSACVEFMMGEKPHIHYHLIPGVVYTWPEVAAVGYTEEELKSKGIAYKTGSFPFKASGRARVAEESAGFIKILSDKQTDEILGVHMIGPRCADIIGEAVVAMEYRASAEDISRMSHAHPTFTEAVKEAALAATDNRALHI